MVTTALARGDRAIGRDSDGPHQPTPNALISRHRATSSAAILPTMSRTFLPSDPRERPLDVGLWILAAACACATLWFSFFSAPPGARLVPGGDKVEHAMAYGSTLLCFMFAADWRPRRGDGPFPRSALPGAILAILLGILIEWLQGRYFNRTPEVLDVVAEVVGSLGALIVFTLVRSWFDRRPESASARHEASA